MVVAVENLARHVGSISRRCAASRGQLRKASVCSRSCTGRSRKATGAELPRTSVKCKSASAQLQSETELFLENLEQENAEVSITASNLRSQRVQLENQVSDLISQHKSRVFQPLQLKCFLQLQKLQAHIDDLYKGAFAHDSSSNGDTESQAAAEAITGLTEEAFGSLGRTQPQVRSRHCAFYLGLVLVASAASFIPNEPVINLLCVFHTNT